MERKIGETFEYEGKKLKVVEEDSSKCKKCFFYVRGCLSSKDVTGFCLEDYRTDKKNVIFVEYNEEQPHEEPQQLNLCEILKNCPMGEPFWSPLYGDLKLYCIDQDEEEVVVRPVGIVHSNIHY